MKPTEIKLATSIARDSSIDLSDVDDGILFGFGLPDFKPVTVSLRVVAKCMRWQCSYVLQKKGGPDWNWEQYNEDLPYYRRNVAIADFTSEDARAWLVEFVTSRLEQTTIQH